jgi:hypothetical protein
MTHKRCRKTGRKAKVESTALVNKGDTMFLRARDTVTGVCDKYFVAPCDYVSACKQLLRDETKLDRYLDGSDNG